MLIWLDKVSKSYTMGCVEVQALHDISMCIDKGEFVVLAGPSGSGKSTLLNIIGCLDTPSSGSYVLKDKPVLNKDLDELASLRNEHIGFVFQDFNLIPVLNVFENIALPITIRAEGITPKTKEHVFDIIEAVGLSNHVRHRPDELSGGQRQRVAIARALATKPSLVLADEPTANLDSKNAKSIVDLMLGLNQDLGVTFVFSSHDQRLMSMAPRVVSIEDGQLTGRVSFE